MGKPFVSSQLELARNRQRDSLDIFGQTSLLQQQHRAPGSHTNVPLFSKVPGSAWDNALKEAERLLEGNHIPTGRPSNAKRLEQRSGEGPPAAAEKPKDYRNDAGVTVEQQEQQRSSLNDLIGRLEEAEKDPGLASKQWTGVVEESFRMDEHAERQQQQQTHQLHQLSHHQLSHHQRHESSDGYDSRRSRKSSESLTTRSEVSEDFMQERAAQWGYGVVLKGSSRESTPRTSGGSSTGGRSRAGSSSSQAIPVVSRDVKDALSSFMLAFLVCDAADPEMPILYASAGFTSMTGYATDEIVGKNCRFLQGPDTDRLEIAKVKKALNNGSIYTGTVLNYKKDGTPFWNLLTLSPIKDDDGKIIKYIGMQAEQNSNESQPRNAKGQKSPAVRASPGPSKLSTSSQDGNEKQKRTSEEAGPSQRRNSAGSASTPRPPLVPQKASPAPTPTPATAASFSDRYNCGPELRADEDQPKRMSQRYSLTSNPTRSTRNSAVEEFRQSHRSRNSSVTSSAEDFQHTQHRREAAAAALQLREMVLNGGKSSSSFETPGTSTRRDSQSSASSEKSRMSIKSEKSKTNRLTSRILRLFRRDSKVSKGRMEEMTRGKDVVELSASDDEEDDFDDNSARGSEGRRHSSVGSYSTTSQARLEAPVDDLAERLARMTMGVNGAGQQMSSAKPAFDGSKQFCFVESSAPPAYDGSKQQFCIVEPSSSSAYDEHKQQFEPPSSPAYDVNKKQFCLVEPSAPPPLPFNGSNKQQFCIVHT